MINGLLLITKQLFRAGAFITPICKATKYLKKVMGQRITNRNSKNYMNDLNGTNCPNHTNDMNYPKSTSPKSNTNYLKEMIQRT